MLLKKLNLAWIMYTLNIKHDNDIPKFQFIANILNYLFFKVNEFP